MWELQLRTGDRVVLCSDGLSNEVSLDELGEILGAKADPDEAAQTFVDAANEHGGADNITVVVVDVLIGEEDTSPASVIKPIGQRAGPPLIVAPVIPTTQGDGPAGAAGDAPDDAGQAEQVKPTTAEVPVVAAGAAAAVVASGTRTAPDPMNDTLAPGAQLGFGGDSTRLGSGSDDPQSGEHFLGNTGGGPIARSTVRASSPRPPAPVPANESRRARRRRLGIQRRVTVRVVLFTLLILAIPVAAFFVVRWYAYDNWYPAVQGNTIVIENGRSGGVLWFKPKVVDHPGVATSGVLPETLSAIRAGVQEPTLKKAQAYVYNAHRAYLYQKSAQTPTGGSGANGVGPSGALPTTTLPTSNNAVPPLPGAATTTTTTLVAPQ